jgi:prepilin-type N-terminal cleavage/methylation domain-containing protein
MRKRSRRGRSRRRAFTLVELLVVIAILAVLSVLTVTTINKAIRSAHSVRCLSNLRQIAIGFRHYATLNDGRLPDPPALDKSWEEVLQPYLNTKVNYTCPADDELGESLGTSYDWRDTGDPATTLAGRTIYEAKGETVLTYDALPNWHASRKMNAVCVDGSARAMDAWECITNLMTPLRLICSPPSKAEK